MTPANVLRELMRACVDDERTLLHERQFVDPQCAAKLEHFAREREQFVTDLERIAEPSQRPTGSWAELLREAARNAWVTAAGRNTGDAIATCRHSRARTEALYDVAMQRPWSGETWSLLTEQRRKLHDEAEELNHLQF
jgi:hypothetical protein